MKFTVPDALCQLLMQLAVPAEQILAQAHLSGRLIQGEIKLSPLEYYQLIAAAEPYLDSKALLRVCEISTMTQFSAPVYGALVATNGLVALQRLATYKHLIGPVTMTVTELPDTVEVHYAFVYPQMAQLQIAVFVEQLLAVNLLRTGSGQAVVPLTVASSFAYDSELTAHFEVRPVKVDENLLVFDKADVMRPFSTANNVMWQVLAPSLESKLAESNQDDPLMAAVQQRLVQNVAQADASIASVGNALGMSPRSLQREFKQRNTTFKQLLAHAKQMLAINYAQNFHLPLIEIAYLLGYSEPSAFSRAFRQWTGVPFSDYQAQA